MNPLFPIGFILDTTALVAAYDNVQDAAYLVETARDYHRAMLTIAECEHQVTSLGQALERYTCSAGPDATDELDQATAGVK